MKTAADFAAWLPPRSIPQTAPARQAPAAIQAEFPRLAKTACANPLVSAADYDEASGGDLRFSVTYGKARQEEMRRLLAKYRPDLQDAAAAVAEVVKFDTNAEANAAFRWLCRNTVILPQDAQIVKDAVETAAKAKVDPARYDRPGDILEQFTQFRPVRPADPATVPELSDRRDLGDGIVTYEVSDTREGQAAMRASSTRIGARTQTRGVCWQEPAAKNAARTISTIGCFPTFLVARSLWKRCVARRRRLRRKPAKKRSGELTQTLAMLGNTGSATRRFRSALRSRTAGSSRSWRRKGWTSAGPIHRTGSAGRNVPGAGGRIRTVEGNRRIAGKRRAGD